MEGFLSSFTPFIEKYKTESIILAVSLLIAVISLVTLGLARSSEEEPTVEFRQKSSSSKAEYVLVEVAGSVESPDVYRVKKGTRLKDLLAMAGGLSKDADRNYVARNLNLALILADEQKIYIPSGQETTSGSNLSSEWSILSSSSKNPIIHLNSASAVELDQLPGIGKITAQKIIDNRPYNSIEELVNKKVIYKSVFEKIKSQIEL